ncbi:MAG: tRNA pseudouridine(55) synthase TruB [Enhygromyxa sp.]
MARAEQGRAGPGPFGILLIDKPPGPTSHDLVGWVRWALRERAVGHCGTLDPAATGLLVVCVGAATKLVEHLSAVDKRYLARFVLGRSTTTADAEGETLEQVELPVDALEQAEQALGGLTGRLELPPPAYSAVKIGGRRAHALARAGEAPELPARPMTVERLELVGRGPDWIEADLTVTKGTYVRSLAEELGRRLGLPAHLGALRRLACGDLRVDDPIAVTGLQASELPPIEGRAPRWRVQLQPSGDSPEAAREHAAAALQERLAPPWERLPFPASVLEGSDHRPTLDRLLQGQRLRLDAPTSKALGLPAEGSSELHAIVDRAVGCMVLVRRDSEQRRLVPIRVLRFG